MLRSLFSAARRLVGALLPEARWFVVGDLTVNRDRFGDDHYRVVGVYRFRVAAILASHAWVGDHRWGSAHVVPPERMAPLLSELGRDRWLDVDGKEAALAA